MMGQFICRGSQNNPRPWPVATGLFCFFLLFFLLNGKNLYYLKEREEIMSANIFRKKSVMAMFLVVLLGAVGMGCTTTVKERQQGQPVTGPTPEAKAEWEEVGKFYLDDVRVPSELNYKPGESMVYETAKFKAGVLRFSKWRLDVQSLIDFFTYNMVRDNWTFVNSFRGEETHINFSKPDKTCTIKITETWTGMTHVTIRVGPLGEKKM